MTRRCNANCPFCFYLKSGGAPVEPRPELSLAEIEKVSSSLGSLLWLAFSGGEIFLRSDLAEIAGIFYRNNRPAIMLLPTNGLLPELILDRMETILRSCPKSIVALKLSLDNIGDAHDALRRTPGSFKKTLRTYELVSSLADRYPNFELGVNTVFCADNQNDMENIIEYVRGMGRVKTHTISLVRGDLSDRHFTDVDLGLYQEAVEKLESNLKEGKSPVYRFRGGRLKAAQDILQRRLIFQTMTERKWIMPCYAGKLNLVLGETGEVYPCELIAESFGNVRDFACDLRKAAGSERAKKAMTAIRDAKCFCTHECYFMTNILFNPRQYPALLGEYLQLRTR